MSEFWSWFEGYAVPKMKLDGKTDRTNTFRKMFKHLDKFKYPTIMETGCADTDNLNWKDAGCSTLLFDKYVSINGGRFYSVDIDQEKVDKISSLIGENSIIRCGDSVDFLKFVAKSTGPSPHLVYLDSYDLTWHLETESQVHHYNELKAIMPTLSSDTLVVVDDSPSVMDEKSDYKVRGKGGLVAKYAAELGVPLLWSEYQSAWQGFPGFKRKDDDSNEEIIDRARKFVENGQWSNAYPLYNNLLVRTAEYGFSAKQRIIHGEACAFFARLEVNADRIGTSYDWFRRALRADPRATEYRLEFITRVLIPMSLFLNAKTEAKRAVKISPEDVRCWRVLANVQSSLDEADESIATHRKQIEISERDSLSLFDLATVLIDTEQYDEAEELANEILERKEEKGREDGLHLLALIRSRRGEHEEAIELFEEVLKNMTGHMESLARFHLSLSQHSIGRYKEGFKNLSYRINNKSNAALFVPMRRFKKPLFEMQDPPAVVHVHSEAGDGDNLCLMRYLPLLVGKGYTVRYECRDNLLKLASDSLKGVEVVPEALDHPGALGLKDFDYHLPIGECQYQFETDIDTVPWYGPYIKADPVLVEKYKAYKGKIGICWSSGIREQVGIWIKRYGQHKSPSFEKIKPIILNSDRFVSLQAGPPRTENPALIEDVLPDNPTWADTAALIENLDLVITPDTGLAHLAGAMGKPTWIMMHGYNSGWHFMCERPGASWNEKSPWYPSVRLFRQKTPGDWGVVIENIAAELSHKHRKVA